jgi:hypothetical protein
VIVFIDSTATVLEVETWKILQDLVERLLLVLVSFSESEHLMSTELSDFVTLENVILANPIDLTRRVVANTFHLQTERL